MSEFEYGMSTLKCIEEKVPLGTLIDRTPRNADGLTEEEARTVKDMERVIAANCMPPIVEAVKAAFPKTFAPKPEAELSDEQEDALAAAVVTLELADNRGKKAIQLLKSAFPEAFEDEGEEAAIKRREFIATEVGGDPNVKHHLIVRSEAPDAK